MPPVSGQVSYGYSPSPMKPSQVVIQHEAIERAADRPHVEEQIRSGHYVPLWFLLEHPFREVEHTVGPAFLEAGFAPEVVGAISLAHLVSHAFREGSSYWSNLAAGWLADGFSVDESIASAVEASVKRSGGASAGTISRPVQYRGGSGPARAPYNQRPQRTARPASLLGLPQESTFAPSRRGASCGR